MENRTETIAMLIRFYNMQAGTSCRANNDANQRVVGSMLDRANQDAGMVKDHIREWVKVNPEAAKTGHCLTDCVDAFRPAKKEEVQQSVVPTEQAVGNAMGILEQAVVNLIAKTSAEKIEAEIMGTVEDTIRNFIKEEYGTIERKITTIVDGKKVPMQGIQHEKFETVLKFTANKIPVYLYGPAGSGKNELCKQIADALGLKFYFTNAVTQEYKLTGFTDANGNYQATQFYKAFTEGGLFMLDEMDASIPETLNILNAAIANGYFDFPAPIGFTEAHPDFRVIAAGNTLGLGASNEYVGRMQLDAATLNRFFPIKIDYSETIENMVAENDIELADFCRNYRKAAQEAGISIVISYRNIQTLATMRQLLDLSEAIDICIVKGLEKDDINIIAGYLPENKYKSALKRLARVA